VRLPFIAHCSTDGNPVFSLDERRLFDIRVDNPLKYRRHELIHDLFIRVMVTQADINEVLAGWARHVRNLREFSGPMV
jgi:hypothetical protein